MLYGIPTGLFYNLTNTVDTGSKLSNAYIVVQSVTNRVETLPGPSIEACMSVISSSLGYIFIPSGGLFVRSAISLAT